MLIKYDWDRNATLTSILSKHRAEPQHRANTASTQSQHTEHNLKADFLMLHVNLQTRKTKRMLGRWLYWEINKVNRRTDQSD